MTSFASQFLDNVVLMVKIVAFLLLIRAIMLICGYGGNIPVLDQLLQTVINLMLEAGQSLLKTIFG